MSLVTFFTPPSLSTIRLMGQTIEELLGVGSRIALRINEDFALNKLHLIEIIVGPEVWTLNLLRANDVHIKEVRLYVNV